ncbi:MAG: phytoene/squalene synthase family protein [Culicoidibacterales bacterium]
MDKKQAYLECEQIIKHHSATFYKAFSLLAKDERNAVYAVYAFCRIVDDIVDEGKNVEQELERFKAEFANFLGGNYDETQAHWVALADVFVRYPMDAQAFQDMIRGQEMDLTITRYETVAELEVYCYHVATTVGLMLLPILVPKVTPILRENAHHLGYALQLTNILRDIHEDYQRARIYLPQALLQTAGVNEQMLIGPKATSEFIQVWETLAAIAEREYELANQQAHLYPKRARLAVYGAAHLYAAILVKIREQNYDVFSCKQYVDAGTKQVIINLLNKKW